MTTYPTQPLPRDYGRSGDQWLRIGDRSLWGPIMAGAICAIGLQFIFTVLGIALGASTGDAVAGVDGSTVRTVSIAAGVWWLITGTLALAVGGFVYGRLSGLVHGAPLNLGAAATWGVVALFGFVVVWSGAGMLTQAASPIAAVSASSLDPYARDNGRTASPSDARQLTSDARATDIQQIEQARQATRTASWWSLFGLVAGLGATIGGACFGSSRRLEGRHVGAVTPHG